MIIADTNVVSEFMKEAPEPAVVSWAQTLEPAALSICAVTVEEVERGLGRLPVGRRRRELEERWQRMVTAFAETIAVYDMPAARMAASILVEAERTGRPMTLADAQIAGICLTNGCELATRNVRDFSGVTNLSVVNPFE